MIAQLANLNWISVVLACFVYSMLGGLWFTFLFIKPYKISLGRDHETLPDKPIFIIGPACCLLVITIASAILIHALDIHTVAGASELSLITGIGYLVANTVNIAINPNIPRPFLYGMISGGYHLVGIFLADLILVLMK